MNKSKLLALMAGLTFVSVVLGYSLSSSLLESVMSMKLVGILIFSLTFFSACVYLVLDYAIFHRIKVLSLQTSSVVEGKSQRVIDTHDSDELKSLVSNFNKLVHDSEVANIHHDSLRDLYMSLVEDAPILVQRFKPDGTMTFANSSYLEHYNLTKEEVQFNNVYDIVAKKGYNPDSLKKQLYALNPDCPVNSKEYPTRDGWMLWINRAIFNEFQALVEYQTIGIDITEQKKTEEELRQSKVLYELLATSTSDLVLKLDEDCKIMYASPSFCSKLNTSNVIGMSIESFVYTEDIEMVESCKNSLVPNESCSVDIRFLTSCGSPIWFNTAITPIVEEDRIVGAVLHSRDVTFQKDSEQKLSNRVKLKDMVADCVEMITASSFSELRSTVDSVLEVITEMMQVDRTYLFLLDGEHVNNSNEHCVSGIEPQIQNLQNIPKSEISWWMTILKNFETLRINDVSIILQRKEKDILTSQGIQSVLCVPVRYNHTLVGFLGLDSVLTTRTWTDEEVNNMELLGLTLGAMFRGSVEKIDGKVTINGYSPNFH